MILESSVGQGAVCVFRGQGNDCMEAGGRATQEAKAEALQRGDPQGCGECQVPSGTEPDHAPWKTCKASCSVIHPESEGLA